jgi:glucokinase
MTGSATIGLDVGGTKIAGGLLTAANEFIEVRQRLTLVDGRRDPGLRVTRQVTEELALVASDLGLTVDGIGAGFPEYVDPYGRLSSREVIEWTTQPEELLADIAPATADSDVRCAALGEGALGVAVGLASYVFVIVGTGLSHAFVEDGQAWAGARGEAMALGELEVPRGVDPGTALSLERYSSGEGIRERYVAATSAKVRGAADVFALALNGDDVAIGIVTSAARAIGVGLATVVRILDPGALVLGGGVSSSGAPWRETVEAAYLDLARARSRPPPILWASLGSEAGMIGAAIAHRGRVHASSEGQP